ncbi:MAG: cell wall hydrolase [Alphaproteobacteria bacterium]|nr:MAG: cell wall hydrolase [Alphaproteobacteria bacterium]
MRRLSRAAALTAAALTFCAAGGLAGPSIASQADTAPAVAYTAHQSAGLTAQNLGLNDLTDSPRPAGGFEAQAPVVTHALAPAFPQATPGDESDDQASERNGRSLSQLVQDLASSDASDEQTDCLARAVYWESKGEPLSGQLAVAEVIINRSHSGRFASTVCGVVRQRGQFSFVHGGHIPAAPQASRDWRTAVAIAEIAQRDLADGGAPRALFFHARRAHPGWRLTRVAAVGNHIFYR